MERSGKNSVKRLGWKLSVMLLAVFVILAGCSGGKGNNTQTSENTQTNEQSGQNNENAAAETLKIGVILSFTGAFAPLAEDIRNGLELFLEEHNYTIGNYKVEVKYEDDEADPQVALRKYNQLKDSEKVDIFVGPISSAVLYALRDQVHNDKELLIVANAAGDAISWDQKSDYVYRVFMSNFQSGFAGGAYFAENLGKKAFVLAPDYAAGHEVIEAFKQSFGAAGGEIVGEVWNPLGTNDFAAYLTQIAKANPDFVFSVQTGTDAVRFMQQYQQFGLKDKYPLASWHEFGNSLNTVPAGDASLDILSVLNYSTKLENEVNQKFVAAYKEKYNETPSVFSVEGYDSGQIIAKAVEEAGSKEAEDLIKVIKGMTFDSPRGTIKLDEKTNNPIQDFYIGKNVKDENGEIVQEVLYTIPQVTMPETKPGS